MHKWFHNFAGVPCNLEKHIRAARVALGQSVTSSSGLFYECVRINLDDVFNIPGKCRARSLDWGGGAFRDVSRSAEITFLPCFCSWDEIRALGIRGMRREYCLAMIWWISWVCWPFFGASLHNFRAVLTCLVINRWNFRLLKMLKSLKSRKQLIYRILN